MDLELSVSTADFKGEVCEALTARGYRTTPGCVRLAHPFAIVVPDLADDDVDVVLAVATAIDPHAGALPLSVPTA